MKAVLQKFPGICTAQKKSQQPLSKLGYSTEELLENHSSHCQNLDIGQKNCCGDPSHHKCVVGRIVGEIRWTQGDLDSEATLNAL